MLNPFDMAERDRFLLNLSKPYATTTHSVFAAPNMCGIYAVLRLKAPVWEIYPFFEHSLTFDRSELEKLKTSDPNILLVDDFALDGNEQYRYSVTHHLIYDYIQRHYQKLPLSPPEGQNNHLEAFVKPL